MNPEDDSPSHPSKARPAPPKSGRPAPPKSGHPAPPTNADVSSSDPQKNSQDIENTTMDKAQDLEERGEYSEAAILYRSLGLTNDENRCLQLALSKSQNEKTTIIHNGDKIIRDSVIMKDEN